ncbi:hypothetical protein [Staphylococcus chromogenes]|nr:hypothetical protein [Staphylococcus chromogenes]PTF69680.1 hypothetical protein BUY01_06340 [Staphylococcus chromogenes]PTF72666.1 hypothetical protein BUY03_04405 [Staphylococcus chromogenes]PTG07634.1 hypothetical protein BU648_05745 [Staphylococcus chromogenes]PTG85851.1 hypothetical protein BU665_00315 [Staphylococcus chromogenes]PUZ21349.1 hypothetical protein BUY00_04935 [Staphylococcus chromogenes]
MQYLIIVRLYYLSFKMEETKDSEEDQDSDEEEESDESSEDKEEESEATESEEDQDSEEDEEKDTELSVKEPKKGLWDKLTKTKKSVKMDKKNRQKKPKRFKLK